MFDLSKIKFAEAELATARGKLDELRTLLDFLVSLEKKQRRNGQKMGQSGKGFVSAMLDVANSHPEILPGKFKKEVLGIQQMKDANKVYGHLQDAVEDDNSLRPTLDRAKVFYQKRNLKDENGSNGVAEKDTAVVAA